MTRLRFYLSMIIVLVFVSLTPIVSGNSLMLFTDIASLILGILIPYIVVSFIYTPKEQKRFNKEIFSPQGEGDPIELKKAEAFYSTFKRVLIYSGILWTVMGFISIGANLQDPESLGPNFAVAMIVPLYVALYLIIIIEPLRASAEKKLVA